MKRQLTLQEYRNIDLALFALMLAIFEFIIIRVGNLSFFRGQLFTASLAGAITSIVYMRWGWWGGIHAALAGGLYCLYCAMVGRDVVAQTYAIYILGNLFSLLAVPALKKLGPERVRQGKLSALVFPLAVILLMQGGRAAVALALGHSPAEALGLVTADSLSILFTLVIVWIARRLDGVYEEQKHYLLRLQEDRERNNIEQ